MPGTSCRKQGWYWCSEKEEEVSSSVDHFYVFFFSLTASTAWSCVVCWAIQQLNAQNLNAQIRLWKPWHIQYWNTQPKTQFRSILKGRVWAPFGLQFFSRPPVCALPMSLTKLFIISSMKSTLAEAKLEQTIQFMSTEAKDYEDSTGETHKGCSQWALKRDRAWDEIHLQYISGSCGDKSGWTHIWCPSTTLLENVRLPKSPLYCQFPNFLY